MSARLELVLSIHHDLLIRVEAGIDERLAVADLRDLDLIDCQVLSGLMTQA